MECGASPSDIRVRRRTSPGRTGGHASCGSPESTPWYPSRRKPTGKWAPVSRRSRSSTPTRRMRAGWDRRRSERSIVPQSAYLRGRYAIFRGLILSWGERIGESTGSVGQRLTITGCPRRSLHFPASGHVSAWADYACARTDYTPIGYRTGPKSVLGIPGRYGSGWASPFLSLTETDRVCAPADSWRAAAFGPRLCSRPPIPQFRDSIQRYRCCRAKRFPPLWQ